MTDVGVHPEALYTVLCYISGPERVKSYILPSPERLSESGRSGRGILERKTRIENVHESIVSRERGRARAEEREARRLRRVWTERRHDA